MRHAMSHLPVCTVNGTKGTIYLPREVTSIIHNYTAMEQPIINCFLPYQNAQQVADTVKNLRNDGCVSKIYLLCSNNNIEKTHPEGCELLHISSLESTSTIKAIAARTTRILKRDNVKNASLSIVKFCRKIPWPPCIYPTSYLWPAANTRTMSRRRRGDYPASTGNVRRNNTPCSPSIRI